jgi:hypothetical protein
MSEQPKSDDLELNIDFSKYFKPEVREFFNKNKTLLGFMGVIILALVIFGGSKLYSSYKSRQVASITNEAASTSQQNVEGTGTTTDNGTTANTDQGQAGQQVATAPESSNSAKPAIAKLPFTGRDVEYTVNEGDNVADILSNVCGGEAKGYVETVVYNLNKIYPGQTLAIICN